MTYKKELKELNLFSLEKKLLRGNNSIQIYETVKMRQ